MKRQLVFSLVLSVSTGLSPGLMAQPTDRYEELTGEADDFDATEKEWREAVAEIPDFPAREAWVQLDMDDAPGGFSLYLDKGRIAVSEKDYVTRYWMKLSSRSGSDTISFEGIRCSTREYQIYAYGHEKRDPKVTPLKTPKWQKMGLRKPGNYRRELADQYLCESFSPKPLKHVKQSIKGRYETLNPYEHYIYFDD